MMKLRKVLIGTSIALALIIPTTVFAATSTSTAAIKIRGLFGIDGSKLTTSQMADVQDYATKMADLQKSLLDKMVSNGSMTQAQADAEKADIDSKLANGEIFIGGGHGPKDLENGKGIGKGIDTSKLTDDQKQTLLALQKEQLSSENDLAKILVDQNLITQAQADSIKTKVDKAIAALTTDNVNGGMFKHHLGALNMLQGRTLTDTQKNAIKGWVSSNAAIEKKIVALYKDAGLITQAQADTMNSQIDQRAADPFSFKMMDNGKMGGKNRGHEKSNKTGSTQADSSNSNSAVTQQ